MDGKLFLMDQPEIHTDSPDIHMDRAPIQMEAVDDPDA